MSSLEEELRRRAAQVKEYIPATNLPDEVEAVIVGEPTFKTDKRGTEALFITLKTRDGKYIAQKYMPTTYKDLEAAIKACGGVKALQESYHIWRKRRSGRTQFDRLFPTPAKTAEAEPEVKAEAEAEEAPRAPKKARGK
jgi:hypothetical protein